MTAVDFPTDAHTGARQQPKGASRSIAPVVTLSVPGMQCAGCIGKVERALNARPEVSHARVNLSLHRVTVQTDLSPHALIDVLKGAGFDAFELNRGLLSDGQTTTLRDLAFRLGLAGFAMMNVMLLSVAVWSGAEAATRDMFHLISAAIAVPVVAYSGQPFFQSAIRALRAGHLNMDVPISLAIGLAAGMSLYEALNGGQHAYFDAALSLTFFLLIGRFLDLRMRSNARSAARELTALEDPNAQRKTEGGGFETVPVSSLRVGDLVLVPLGARIPVDGRLASDRAVTDRSFLTGESLEVSSRKGAALRSGEINLGPPITLEATAVGEDTTLRQIASIVESAEGARTRYTSLADRAARIYAPAVHLLALAAFLGWVLIDGDVRHALNVAIAVLIITCPCALGLAVPAVATAAIGRLFEQGILVKSGTALERLAQVDHITFDKTGTLTLPGLTPNAAALSPDQARVVKAMAQASAHPVSRALNAALHDTDPASLTEILEHPGDGISAQWNGQPVGLGRRAWIDGQEGGLAVLVAGDVVELGMGETLRPGAGEVISTLRDVGFSLDLLTGDTGPKARATADQLGITQASFGIDPTQKCAAITARQEGGARVAMIGDGLNDTAALALAHASIAPASALDASRSAADVILLRGTLDGLPALFAIAAKSTHLARQNFAIAAAYNLIAVPIALLGFATPLIAALAMSASSLTVLANALRVRWAA